MMYDFFRFINARIYPFEWTTRRSLIFSLRQDEIQPAEERHTSGL